MGPNATMLDQDGHLTDIGSWYLGGAATGHVPEGNGGVRICAGWLLLAVVAQVGLLLF